MVSTGAFRISNCTPSFLSPSFIDPLTLTDLLEPARHEREMVDGDLRAAGVPPAVANELYRGGIKLPDSWVGWDDET